MATGLVFAHQRLIKSISERKTSRFILSGDIHAIGATSIIESDAIKLKEDVKTFLVGPIGSSSAGWPSFARGIAAENPNYLVCNSIYKTREENGFTLFKIYHNEAYAEINSCGGHDPSNGDTGKIISNEKIYL